MRKHCSRRLVSARFCPSSFSLLGRKASSRNTSSRCTIVGLREAFGPVSKVMAKLVSARSFLASRLLCSGLYLQAHTAPHSTRSEDGERRGETPGPRELSSKSSTSLFHQLQYRNWFPSPICFHRLRHKGKRGECGLLVASETDTPSAH